MEMLKDSLISINLSTYKKLLEKIVDGQQLTNADLVLLSIIRKDISRAVDIPPINKLIDGIKQVQKTLKDFDLSKKNPQIYVKTCEKMGESPSDTVVFEDALYAVESAKKAQCTVIGVYDEYSKCDWQNIKNIANSTIDWR